MPKKVKVKSNLEAEVFRILNAHRKELDYKLEYEPEALEYTLTKRYVPDFVLSFKDGRKIYLESKGYLRPENKAQLLSVKEQHPDIDLRIIFQRDNRFPRSKMRYSDWAKKHEIKFSVGEIPLEWFH